MNLDHFLISLQIKLNISLVLPLSPASPSLFTVFAAGLLTHVEDPMMTGVGRKDRPEGPLHHRPRHPPISDRPPSTPKRSPEIKFGFPVISKHAVEQKLAYGTTQQRGTSRSW
jgi:hypothetical protein